MSMNARQEAIAQFAVAMIKAVTPEDPAQRAVREQREKRGRIIQKDGERG